MLFSAELPWCCFCVEIKVLGMERNFARIFYTINNNFWSQDPPGWAQPTRARPPLLARPGGLSPPDGPADPDSNSISTYFSRKKQGDRIIAIDETKPPSPPILHREARSGVRLGLQRGGSCSSSLPTLLHRQFHDAPHRG